MFTRAGREVEIVERLPAGTWLIRPVLDGCDKDGNDVLVLGPPEIVDQLYEEAPTERYDQRIEARRRDLAELDNALAESRTELRRLRKELATFEKEHAARLTEYRRYDQLKQLDDFIASRVTHYVLQPEWDSVHIVAFGDMKAEYGSHRPRLLTLFGDSKGKLDWGLNNFADGSGGNTSVIPCTSLEQAQQVLRECLTEQMAERKSRHLLEMAIQNGVPLPEGYEEAVKGAERRALKSDLAGIQSKAREIEARLGVLNQGGGK